MGYTADDYDRSPQASVCSVSGNDRRIQAGRLAVVDDDPSPMKWIGARVRFPESVRRYVSGSLWVLPGLSALAALVLGWSVSQINIGPDSWLAPLTFQGTADDARALLTDITNTVVTVIALVLGLTVVALQLSS